MSIIAGTKAPLRAVLQRPALLAIEIAWRWTFGCTVLLCLAWALVLFMRETGISETDLTRLTSMSPDSVEAAVQNIFKETNFHITRVTAIVGSAILIAWTVLASIGRALTTAMIVRRRVRFLAVALPQALRALLALSCAAWLTVTVLFAARLAIQNPDAEPQWALYYGLALLDLVVVAIVGTAGNWVLWLWSITAGACAGAQTGFRAAISLLKNPAQIEFQAGFGILRLGLIVAMLGASILSASLGFALGNIAVTALLIAFTLFYFVTADLLQVSRVVAIVFLVSPLS